VYQLSVLAIPGLKAVAAALGRISSPYSRLDGGGVLAGAADRWVPAHAV
jgi:hypothetical protein